MRVEVKARELEAFVAHAAALQRGTARERPTPTSLARAGREALIVALWSECPGCKVPRIKWEEPDTAAEYCTPACRAREKSRRHRERSNKS